MVDKPTRLNNTFDLFITHNPTLISEIKVIHSRADPDAVTIEGDISPIVYKKADWDDFKEFMQGFSDEICDRTPLSNSILYFYTRDVTVDDTLKFVNTKARAVNQTN